MTPPALAQRDRVEFDLEKLVLARIRKLDGTIDALLSGKAKTRTSTALGCVTSGLSS